jgi:hypothetical protein
MNSLRCPQLDRLGRELIEAYRHMGDTDIFCLAQGLDGPDEVSTVHRKMAEHRRLCFLCMHAENTHRNAVVFY